MRQSGRSITQQRLPLASLDFGKVDARYEVITRDERSKEHFRESFLQPSGLSIDEFMDGHRFFVFGPKGAGKTALLKYVQLEAEANKCLTHFVTFSTDITEEERERLTKDAGFQLVDSEIDPGSSAISIWQLYIFRIIARIIDGDKKKFTANRSTKNFCGLIKQFFEGEDTNTLKWLAQALRTGTYKVKSRYLDATLKGDEGKKEKSANLKSIVTACYSYLEDLNWEGSSSIYIIFDELNLSFTSRTQHRRDAVLIRDLILAIDHINSHFILMEKQLYVLAAARSEVIHAISVPTHEVEKCLADRGRELKWYARVASEKAPIVDLFEKKVRASEYMHGRAQSKDVFDSYFRSSIYNLNPASVIVELTWCNPRDIISLFGPAAQVPDAVLFDENTLSKVIMEYSAKCWREKVEELNVEYAAAEVEAVKRVLMGCNVYFRRPDFDITMDQRSRTDDAVKALAVKRKGVRILESLYRIGIIGQRTRKPTPQNDREYHEPGTRQFEEHWAHRGDSNFDPDAWMVLHRAIWPNLRKGRIFGNK